MAAKKERMEIKDLWREEVGAHYSKAEVVVKGLCEKYGVDTVEALENKKDELHIKSLYPRVYYARKKNGKHGVTLPPAFSHGASAVDCIEGCNSLTWAIAFAMKVEELLSVGTYTYFEWVRKFGYLSHGRENWDTGREYVRQDPKSSGFIVVQPQTGIGYELVPASKDMDAFETLESAVFRRNQRLFGFVKAGVDKGGRIPADRIAKYRRILTKGYFQAIRCGKENFKNDVCSAFANAVKFCDDETLARTMKFFSYIYAGTGSKEVVLKYARRNMREILTYFDAVEMSDSFILFFKDTTYDILRTAYGFDPNYGSKRGGKGKNFGNKANTLTNAELSAAIQDLNRRFGNKRH